MQDYQGNANKNKTEGKPPKNIEKVVVVPVVVQKKSIGRKFKDLFHEADIKGVTRYVISDVLIPAARNMIVDGVESGIRRIAYGERAMRQRTTFGYGSRTTYNSPISRSSVPYDRPRMAPPVEQGPRRSSRPAREDFLLSSREEAELVLERMNDIIDNYEVATVGDLNELVGLPSSHVDNKWGWVFVGDVQVRQVREGYLIDFPPPEPIS